jgi:hypothetical protein
VLPDTRKTGRDLASFWFNERTDMPTLPQKRRLLRQGGSTLRLNQDVPLQGRLPRD